MSVRLLDVNVLIALLDTAHVHHKAAVKWFRRVAAREGWSTCALTENGFLRIVSHLRYPNVQLTPATAAGLLAQFKAGFPESYRFWEDQVSLTDTGIFALPILTSAGQVTDVYLAGLAFHRGGRLATFDRHLPWRAVKGASADLVEQIA